MGRQADRAADLGEQMNDHPEAVAAALPELAEVHDEAMSCEVHFRGESGKPIATIIDVPVPGKGDEIALDGASHHVLSVVLAYQTTGPSTATVYLRPVTGPRLVFDQRR